jgi:hypothetical protein
MGPPDPSGTTNSNQRAIFNFYFVKFYFIFAEKVLYVRSAAVLKPSAP